jgi:hypothetical protein
MRSQKGIYGNSVSYPERFQLNAIDPDTAKKGKNMNRKIAYITVCGLCLTVLATGVDAADVGDPTGAALLEDARIDFVVERYERDVEYSDVVFESASIPTEPGTQEETRFMARLSFPVHDKAFMHLDGGATSAADAEGAVAIFGAGLRILIYDSEGQGMDAAIFGSVHYVPRIDYEQSSADPALGRSELTQEESYMEANAGLNLSYVFELQDEAILTPYGGIMLSVLQGDEEVEIRYPESGVMANGTGDVEGDGAVSVFGGVSYTFNEYVSIRAEARLVTQTSISAALSMSL